MLSEDGVIDYLGQIISKQRELKDIDMTGIEKSKSYYDILQAYCQNSINPRLSLKNNKLL